MLPEIPEPYLKSMYAAAAEMWIQVKALEILAIKQYGQEAYDHAKAEANRTRPSWTVMPFIKK
jgi:hypothetical protein